MESVLKEAAAAEDQRKSKLQGQQDNRNEILENDAPAAGSKATLREAARAAHEGRTPIQKAAAEI